MIVTKQQLFLSQAPLWNFELSVDQLLANIMLVTLK